MKRTSAKLWQALLLYPIPVIIRSTAIRKSNWPCCPRCNSMHWLLSSAVPVQCHHHHHSCWQHARDTPKQLMRSMVGGNTKAHRPKREKKSNTGITQQGRALLKLGNMLPQDWPARCLAGQKLQDSASQHRPDPARCTHSTSNAATPCILCPSGRSTTPSLLRIHN